MNSDQFLHMYGRISDAPNAVARLREFVLDLAVQGRLVAQDPATDDPASSSIADIRQVAAKSRRPPSSERPLSTVPGEHAGNDIRLARWAWHRLGDIATLVTKGSTPTSYGHAYTDQGINFVRVESIRNGELLSKNIVSFISQKTHDFLARSKLQAGDVLFSIAGSIGTCACVTADVLPANTNQALAIIRGTEKFLYSQFLLIVLRSSASKAVRERARGGAMNNVSLQDIRDLLVPVPPMSEQYRIVAKVDELMMLCDQLEKARADREMKRDKLTAATFARLKVPSPESFRNDARFTLENLEALTTRPDQIRHLRESILSLAVRGRLSEQSIGDKPASALLAQIRAAKDALGLPRVESDQRDESMPFDLPVGWAWTRIGEIASKTGSGSTPRGGKSAYKTVGVPFLRSQNVHNDGLRLTDVAFIDHHTHKKMSGTAVAPRDLLLNITGGSMGRCCHVPADFGEANVSQHVAIIRCVVPEVSDFLHKLVLSPYFQAFIFDEQTGAGRGGLPKNRMDRIAVAVPPLAEQKRIVAKVDMLMSVCDQLEVALSTGTTTRSRLLETVLLESVTAFSEQGQICREKSGAPPVTSSTKARAASR